MAFIEDSGRGYRRVIPSSEPIEIIEVDVISSLVSVDHVVIAVGGGGIPVDFGKPTQRGIAILSMGEAREHIQDGQFPTGSMLLKVESTISIVASRPGSEVIIMSLERADEAIAGKTGTRFVEEVVVK